MGNTCCAQGNTTPSMDREESNMEGQQTQQGLRQEMMTTPDQQQQQDTEHKHEMINEESKFQKTEIIGSDLIDVISKRVNSEITFLNDALKELPQILSILFEIYDPNEVVIKIRSRLAQLFQLLSNYQAHWIGRYEPVKETPEFLKSLTTEIQQLRTFLIKKQEEAAASEKAKTESAHSVFKQLLMEDTVIKQLQNDFLVNFQKKFEQYDVYHSIRAVQSTKANIGTYTNLDEEVNSSLPSYIRKYYREKKGFIAWSEMFNSALEVSHAEFTTAYSAKCKIEASKIQFILAQINSGVEGISLFEFLHFIHNNPEFFDENGHILSNKHSDIDKAIETLLVQKKSTAQKKSDEQFEYANGTTFDGKQDEQGLRTGHGKTTFFGITYEGNFAKDLFDGQGQLTFPDGSQYAGEFQANRYHGKGTFTDYNNVSYEGEWKQGVLAQGKITYGNGLVYEGALLNNRFRHGAGKVFFEKEPTKVLMEGTFEWDELANGKFIFSQNAYYQGTFNTVKPLSKGTFQYLEGKYEGEIDTFCFSREGQGALTWDQDKIEGTWQQDTPLNAVQIFDVKQPENRYEGEWSHFQRNGNGKFYYQSGAVYEGSVQDSKRHGFGKYQFKNGNQYVGEWENNLQCGVGKFTFTNGDIYVGQFKDGKFHGYGKYSYKNKSSYEGQWSADKWNGMGIYINDKGETKKQGIFDHDKCSQEQDCYKDIKELETKFQEQYNKVLATYSDDKQQQPAPVVQQQQQAAPVVVEQPKQEQQQKVEQPKQEQPKQEQQKVEEPKQEQQKVEQPKQEQQKVEQPKQEQPKQEQQQQVEQPKQEQQKVEQPKQEQQQKVEEPKQEQQQQKVEEPKQEQQQKVEEPKKE